MINNMINFLLVAILVIILSACSTSEERREIAKQTGEIIWQEWKNSASTADIFLIRKNNQYKMVFVNADGAIYKIEPLTINQ